jgi:hypothetical protein
MTKKLKVKLIIVGIQFFSCINLNAQNFDIGVATGFNMVSVNDIHSSDDDFLYTVYPIASYNLNGFLSFRNKSFWGFSVEPGIIRKGWNQSSSGLNEKIKIRLNYLQIPILSDFYLSDRFYVSIGPEINYLINAKNKYGSDTQDIVKYTNRFELSGMIGISYKINEIISTSIRYSHGLTEISDDIIWTNTEIENPEDSKEFNQYLQILIKMRLKNWR